MAQSKLFAGARGKLRTRRDALAEAAQSVFATLGAADVEA
jgi:hypothetical protein